MNPTQAAEAPFANLLAQAAQALEYRGRDRNDRITRTAEKLAAQREPELVPAIALLAQNMQEPDFHGAGGHRKLDIAMTCARIEPEAIPSVADLIQSYAERGNNSPEQHLKHLLYSARALHGMATRATPEIQTATSLRLTTAMLDIANNNRDQYAVASALDNAVTFAKGAPNLMAMVEETASTIAKRIAPAAAPVATAPVVPAAEDIALQVNGVPFIWPSFFDQQELSIAARSFYGNPPFMAVALLDSTKDLSPVLRSQVRRAAVSLSEQLEADELKAPNGVNTQRAFLLAAKVAAGCDEQSPVMRSIQIQRCEQMIDRAVHNNNAHSVSGMIAAALNEWKDGTAPHWIFAAADKASRTLLEGAPAKTSTIHPFYEVIGINRAILARHDADPSVNSHAGATIVQAARQWMNSDNSSTGSIPVAARAVLENCRDEQVRDKAASLLVEIHGREDEPLSRRDLALMATQPNWKDYALGKLCDMAVNALTVGVQPGPSTAIARDCMMDVLQLSRPGDAYNVLARKALGSIPVNADAPSPFIENLTVEKFVQRYSQTPTAF